MQWIQEEMGEIKWRQSTFLHEVCVLPNPVTITVWEKNSIE